MKNLWTISKEILQAALTNQAPEAETKWDILFVSAYGRVVRIKNFKRHVLLFFLFLVITVITALALGMLYTNEKARLKKTQTALSVSQKTISRLVEKNDELVAKVVSLQQKIGTASTDENFSEAISSPIVDNGNPSVSATAEETVPDINLKKQ